MPTLCLTQSQLLNRCIKEIARFGEAFPTLLLMGRSGVGKRTIALSIADSLGMRFVEIPLAGPAVDLQIRLFGSKAEILSSKETQAPPGELASMNNCLVYLSELQQLPNELHHDFQRLVTQRIYRDSLGRKWKLPADLFLVVGLTEGLSGTVTTEHWLRHQFRVEATVAVPQNDNEILEIIKGAIKDIDPTCKICLSKSEAISLMKAAQWNLRTLIGWLNKAALDMPASVIDHSQIWKALENDIEYSLL